MSIDFRALCKELVDALLCWQSDGAWIDQAEQSRLIARARTALAEPEPVAPTDEELDEFAVFWWGSDTDEHTVTDVIECCSMAAFARAVLAHAGRRPKPPNLKEQALKALEPIERYASAPVTTNKESLALIRKALEALPND